jgi:hypothetical protein
MARAARFKAEAFNFGASAKRPRTAGKQPRGRSAFKAANPWAGMASRLAKVKKPKKGGGASGS